MQQSPTYLKNQVISSNQLGPSMNLSLDSWNENSKQPSALSRAIPQVTIKTIYKEQLKLIQKQAVLNV